MAYYGQVVATTKKGGGKMILGIVYDVKQICDSTIGRVGKWILWKTGYVDLIWCHGRLRIVRTDAKTGERFALVHGESWDGRMEVDDFFDKSTDFANETTWSKRDYQDPNNDFRGLGHFAGFFSKPKIKNHIFKTPKVKALHLTAGWDRDKKQSEIKDEDTMLASHAHQYTPAPSIIPVVSALAQNTAEAIDNAAKEQE